MQAQWGVNNDNNYQGLVKLMWLYPKLNNDNNYQLKFGSTTGVEFKQKFQLASMASRYKNQLALQIFY
jgi:hypothetical protein